MKRILAIFFVLISCLADLHAQNFGAYNPSIKWKQVNNDKIRVVFPAGLEKNAIRVAEIGRALNVGTRSTIGYSDWPINFILQSNTTVSNGFVQLAPWKSELFLTPLQNSLQLGGLQWIDLLIFHEYRHVQQYMNFRKGLSKWAWYFAGQQGQAIANNIAIPNWFFEGDAVLQETRISEQGRGRLPSFFNDFRVLWDAKRTYSFAKLRNGSYRHVVPNHYLLGYMLTSYGADKYKPAMWEKITNDAVRFKHLIYPFKHAFENYTDDSLHKFVKEAIGEFQSVDLYYPSDSATLLTFPSENLVKDYHLPIIIGKDSILTLRKTDQHLPAFVLITNDKESILSYKDIGLDDYYTYRNGIITYTTYTPSLKYNKTDYSDIITYNIKTKTKKLLTTKMKYFSPEISPSGGYIAAVEILPEWRSSIHLLNSQGQLIKIIKDDRYSFSYPKFGKSDSSFFVALKKEDGKMTLAEINTLTSEITELFPFALHAIAFPNSIGDSVYFTATMKGQDKLMLWNNKTKSLYIAGNRHSGIYEVSSDGNKGVVFSGGTAWGKMLYQFKPNPTPLSLEEWKIGDKDLYLTISEDVNYKMAVSDTNSIEYKVRDYDPNAQFFNIHSWRPTYFPPEYRMTLFNDNIMNNVSASLFYSYNQNEDSHKVGGYGVLAITYPWLLGGAEIVRNRRVFVDSRNRLLDEYEGYVGVHVPVNLTSGIFFKNISFTSLMHVNRLNYKQLQKVIIETKNYGFFENVLNFSILSQQSKQHIYPRLGMQLSVRDRRVFTSTTANQFNTTASFFLPGILSNHHFVFDATFQSRDTKNKYIFSNNFFGAKGYESLHLNYPQMWKLGLNYHFPIAYPEIGWGNLVYLSRLRVNAFYDHSALIGAGTINTIKLRSAGTELYFDTKWFNQHPISFGIRYSRLLDVDKLLDPIGANQFSFVLPINLLNDNQIFGK
jgi:hypothetical protein